MTPRETCDPAREGHASPRGKCEPARDMVPRERHKSALWKLGCPFCRGLHHLPLHAGGIPAAQSHDRLPRSLGRPSFTSTCSMKSESVSPHNNHGSGRTPEQKLGTQCSHVILLAIISWIVVNIKYIFYNL